MKLLAFAITGFIPSFAAAQEMEPRLYSNAPVGMNFLIMGLAGSSGGLSTDPASPLKNAKLKVETPLLAYAHIFAVGDMSAKIDVIAPWSHLSGSADVNGAAGTRDVSGLNDLMVRLSLNFIGAPALSLPEFASYKQDLIVGASVQVSAPTGQYDAGRLVNIGRNHWVLRPEIGISKAIGAFTFELAQGVSFYSENPSYFGGRTQERQPVFITRANLIYRFTPKISATLHGMFMSGGQSRLNGTLQNDIIETSRAGATVIYDLDAHNSFKLYGSKGITVRTGTNFVIFGAAWQYRWGGGLL